MILSFIAIILSIIESQVLLLLLALTLIVDLGQSKQMYAVAEVYEKDIGRVHLGQRATITSLNGAFQRNLLGTVDEIGREIGKKDVLDTDPAADVDARVVEVKIHLDPADSQKVVDLSNLKVKAAIILP